MSAQERVSWQDRILRIMEPVIFARRWLTLTVIALLTAFFGYMASQTHIDAGYMKSVPTGHPYMQTLRKYRDELGGANIILVALMTDKEDIYYEKFLATLKQVTSEVFFLQGVRRSRVKSIFTPNVQYIEVVEGGLKGANIVPSDYLPLRDDDQHTDPAMLRLIESRVEKAGIIGRLVANNERGALVKAELMDYNPVTDEEVDYYDVYQALQDIRHKYETEHISIHIIGFPMVVGSIIDSALEVFTFFVITLGIMAVLLWAYLGSPKLAFLVLIAGSTTYIWEFGLLTLFGYGLDPFAILVPFLVLVISVSHGVQYANCWARERAYLGRDSYWASVHTFRQLFIPGFSSLATALAGILTILLIPIQIIQEMAINAAFGMVGIIMANKILIPVLLSYVRLRDGDKFDQKQINRNKVYDKLWAVIAEIPRPGVAVPLLLFCAVLTGAALWKAQFVQIGSTTPGAPALRPNSQYNIDNRIITSNFSIGTDRLKIMAVSDPNACIDYDVMREMLRFGWHMRNTKGVKSVLSLAKVAKRVNFGFQGGYLKLRVLPRHKYLLSLATSQVGLSTGLLSADCSVMPIILFTRGHQAEMIENVIASIKEYKQNSQRDNNVTFQLASGNVGVMAAKNDVIERMEFRVMFLVYAAIIVLVLISFRSFSALVCIVAPLAMVTTLSYTIMAFFNIGLKASTLPIQAIAVGIGVDYGVYVYSVFQEGVRDFGLSLRDAYYRSMQKNGKAVVFVAITLAAGVSTWLFSSLQFQVDMGMLLLFIFIANLFGAVFVLPALAYFFMSYKKPEGGYNRLEDIDETQAHQ